MLRRFARSEDASTALQDRPGASGEGLLTAAAYERLARRVDAASRKARGVDGATLVSVTCSPGTAIEPLAVLTAARSLNLDDAGWLEHPEHDGQAVAGLGAAAVAAARGPDRFGRIAAVTAERTAGMLADDSFDDPEAPPGAGVVWLGGFAFGDAVPRSNHWSAFDGCRFVLPVVAIARREGGAPASRLTVNLVVRPGDSVRERLDEIDELLDALNAAAPAHPEGNPAAARAASAAGADHYVNAVRRAVERIAAGEFEKLVLARELELESDAEYDPAVLGARMRGRFPGCLSFALLHAGRAYVGATPELLVRREGRRVSTMALAGSARRGLDTAADDHLGRELLASGKEREEHAIVVRRIERTLGRLSAWVAAAREPELVKVKNIQHLATPIRAQLLEPRHVLELAGALHPTPAVGGEPWPEAAGAIDELEGFDRGWYTGGLGWMDALEDGELFVGLRCALVEGHRARLFAGAGIVAESDPSAELAETETKLEALLPVLGGTSA